MFLMRNVFHCLIGLSLSPQVAALFYEVAKPVWIRDLADGDKAIGTDFKGKGPTLHCSRVCGLNEPTVMSAEQSTGHNSHRGR